MSPLAKWHRSEPGLTEIFELFVGKKEISSNLSKSHPSQGAGKTAGSNDIQQSFSQVKDTLEDVLAKAKNGTGKTRAHSIPILESINTTKTGRIGHSHKFTILKAICLYLLFLVPGVLSKVSQEIQCLVVIITLLLYAQILPFYFMLFHFDFRFTMIWKST